MRPVRIIVAAGATQVIPMDYFMGNFAIQCVPTGSTYTVSWSLDDPNNNTAVYFAVAAALTAATTNQIFFASNTIIRTLKIAVTGGTSVAITVLQPSGIGGS